MYIFEECTLREIDGKGCAGINTVTFVSSRFVFELCVTSILFFKGFNLSIRLKVMEKTKVIMINSYSNDENDNYYYNDNDGRCALLAPYSYQISFFYFFINLLIAFYFDN